MDTNLIAIIVVGVIYGLDRAGLLERLGLTRKNATDALAELDLAGRTIARLRTERDRTSDQLGKARAEAARLAEERSLEPILNLVQSVFETQQTTLEKLAQFNGALARQEEGLREATEALRMVAGLVVGASDMPVRQQD